MRERILRTVSIILGVAVGALWGRDALAQTQTGWDLPEFARATDAFARGDCKSVWDTVWPLAKNGNHEAQNILLGWMIVTLRPPGFQPESAKSIWIRHLLTMAAYAAPARPRPPPHASDRGWIRKEIPILINELALGSKGDRVTQCYKSSSSFQDCLTLAVSLGVVQKFEDYAHEVDTAARETGIGASCWYPH